MFSQFPLEKSDALAVCLHLLREVSLHLKFLHLSYVSLDFAYRTEICICQSDYFKGVNHTQYFIVKTYFL